MEKNLTVNQKHWRVNKTTLVIAAKLIIAAGLLIYLINSVEYDQIITAIREANLWLIGWVMGLGILNIYLQYSKWRITCNEVLGVKENSKVFRSLFYGFSAGIITPLRVGEYFGRGIEFKALLLVFTALCLVWLPFEGLTWLPPFSVVPPHSCLVFELDLILLWSVAVNLCFVMCSNYLYYRPFRENVHGKNVIFLSKMSCAFYDILRGHSASFIPRYNHHSNVFS